MLRSLLIATIAIFTRFVSAEEFNVVIFTPKFEKFRVVSLKSDWTYDIRTKSQIQASVDHPTKKVKGAKHGATGVLSWERGTIPEARSFGIAAEDAEDATSWNEGLLICTVNLGRELKEDVWLFLGEHMSQEWAGDQDTLDDGWLQCGDGDFDTTLFPRPSKH